ncbi:hypothetical protein D1007_46722 [Hordeum vulgare]|nr:hypothetical protein D1007_46722 [Hordeum vulgare]
MDAQCSCASTPVDLEDVLLAFVLCCSLTIAETDARCLRCKNAEALRLAIKLSQREANMEAATKVKGVSHAKDQERVLRRLSYMRYSFDMTNGSTSSSDYDTPVHADAYMEEGHNRVDD